MNIPGSSSRICENNQDGPEKLTWAQWDISEFYSMHLLAVWDLGGSSKDIQGTSNRKAV